MTIARSKVNQNRNNFITKLTFHLNNRCLMINLPIIQCCINSRNTLSNIPKCLCLLSTVNLRSATLMLWTISHAMLSTISLTLQRLLAITLVLLLRLKSMYFFNCIELIVQRYILIITCTLRSYLLLIPFSISLVITFPTSLRP